MKKQDKSVVDELNISLQQAYTALHQQRENHVKEKQLYFQFFLKFRNQMEQKMRNMQKNYCQQIIRLCKQEKQSQDQINEKIAESEKTAKELSTQHAQQLTLQSKVKMLEQQVKILQQQTRDQQLLIEQKTKFTTDLELQLEKLREDGNITTRDTINTTTLVGSQINAQDSHMSSSSRDNSHYITRKASQRQITFQEDTKLKQTQNMSPKLGSTYKAENFKSSISRITTQNLVVAYPNVTTTMCGEEDDYHNINVTVKEDESKRLTENPTIRNRTKLVKYVPVEVEDLEDENVSPVNVLDEDNIEQAFRDGALGGEKKMKRISTLGQLIQELHSKQDTKQIIQLSYEDETYVQQLVPWLVDQEQSKRILAKNYEYFRNLCEEQQNKIVQMSRQLESTQIRFKNQEQQFQQQQYQNEQVINMLNEDITQLKHEYSIQNRAFNDYKAQVSNDVNNCIAIKAENLTQLSRLEIANKQIAEKENHIVQLQTKMQKMVDIEEIEQHGIRINKTSVVNNANAQSQINHYQNVNMIQQEEISKLCQQLKQLEFANSQLLLDLQKLQNLNKSGGIGGNSSQNSYYSNLIDNLNETIKSQNLMIETKNDQLIALEAQQKQLVSRYNICEQNMQVMKRRLIQMNDKLTSQSNNANKTIEHISAMYENCITAFQEKDQITVKLQEENDVLRQHLQQQEKMLKRGGKPSDLPPAMIPPAKDRHQTLGDLAQKRTQMTKSNLTLTEPSRMRQTLSFIDQQMQNENKYDIFQLFQDRQSLEALKTHMQIPKDDKFDDFMNIIREHDVQDSGELRLQCQETQTDFVTTVIETAQKFAQTEPQTQSTQQQTEENMYTFGRGLERLKQENEYLLQQLEIYQSSKQLDDLNNIMGIKNLRSFQINQQVSQELYLMAREEQFAHQMKIQKLKQAHAKHKCPGIEAFQQQITIQLDTQKNKLTAIIDKERQDKQSTETKLQLVTESDATNKNQIGKICHSVQDTVAFFKDQFSQNRKHYDTKLDTLVKQVITLEYNMKNIVDKQLKQNTLLKKTCNAVGQKQKHFESSFEVSSRKSPQSRQYRSESQKIRTRNSLSSVVDTNALLDQQEIIYEDDNQNLELNINDANDANIIGNAYHTSTKTITEENENFSNINAQSVKNNEASSHRVSQDRSRKSSISISNVDANFQTVVRNNKQNILEANPFTATNQSNTKIESDPQNNQYLHSVSGNYAISNNASTNVINLDNNALIEVSDQKQDIAAENVQVIQQIQQNRPSSGRNMYSFQKSSSNRNSKQMNTQSLQQFEKYDKIVVDKAATFEEEEKHSNSSNKAKDETYNELINELQKDEELQKVTKGVVDFLQCDIEQLSQSIGAQEAEKLSRPQSYRRPSSKLQPVRRSLQNNTEEHEYIEDQIIESVQSILDDDESERTAKNQSEPEKCVTIQDQGRVVVQRQPSPNILKNQDVLKKIREIKEIKYDVAILCQIQKSDLQEMFNQQQLQNQQLQELCNDKEKELQSLQEFRYQQAEFFKTQNDLLQYQQLCKNYQCEIDDLRLQLTELRQSFRSADCSLAIMLGNRQDIIKSAKSQRWRIGTPNQLKQYK